MPVPAQQVIEEADVLRQGGVVEPGEGSDQRVGGHHPAHQVIADGIADGRSDRLLDQRLPRCPGPGSARRQDVPACIRTPSQRLDEGRPKRLGHVATVAVEVGESGLIGRRTDSRET